MDAELIELLEESNRRLQAGERPPLRVIPSETWSGAGQLYVFQVYDMQAMSGWFTRDESLLNRDRRILTIVGWVVSEDEDEMHIASIYDGDTNSFGDGVVVVKENIIDYQELRMT